MSFTPGVVFRLGTCDGQSRLRFPVKPLEIGKDVGTALCLQFNLRTYVSRYRPDGFDLTVLARVEIIEKKPDGFAEAGFSGFIRSFHDGDSLGAELNLALINSPVIGQTEAQKSQSSLPASLTSRASASPEAIESGPDSSTWERNR